MPTYDYRCTKCGHRFELFHGIKDEAVKRCPRCRGKAQRVPAGGAGILFKGTGFYITDYRSKSYREGKKKDTPSGSGGSGGGGGDKGGSGSSGGSGAGSGGSGGGSGGTGGSGPAN